MVDDMTHPVREALRDISAPVQMLGDPGYDEARRMWNLAVDLRPAAVASPRSLLEVTELVRAATAAGLHLAPVGTGHGVGGFTGVDLSDTVIVRMQDFTGVRINAEQQVAVITGGTRWSAVIEAASAHGLTAAHGSAPDVAVAGFVLGGGLSFYGRQHGVSANHVRSVQVVLADGSVVTASATESPDLFWALRGGGGTFGIVTEVQIGLLPYADVFAGMLLWDRSRASHVVSAWAEWSRQVPESVTTSLRIMSFPPRPELPPFLSGRDIVVVDGVFLQQEDQAAALLEPLRALNPEVDTFARTPAVGVLAMHMDPPAPTPGVMKHCVLDTFDEAAVDRFLAQVGDGTQHGLLLAEIRHLGGAFAQAPDDAGVFGSVAGSYLAQAVAVPMPPPSAPAARAAIQDFILALRPWSSTALVPTFTDERIADRFHATDVARLRDVKQSIDPAGTFVSALEL